MSRDLVAVILIGAAAATLLVMQASVGFVGWDTYPIIAASRIQSFSDLRGTFTKWLASGYFPFGFYRPVLNLSTAADYALWGLDPFGYRLTNVLLFAGCGFALFRLTGALLGGTDTLGSLVALVTFIVLPVHRELTTGPFANRGDLLCSLFVVLALLTQLRRIDSARASRQVLPVLCTVLAQASKETALIIPALVFVLGMVAGRPRPGRERFLRAVGMAASHVLGVLVVLVPRALVVGGLGGHVGTSPTALLSRFPSALRQVVLDLVAKAPPARWESKDALPALCFLALLAGVLLAYLRAQKRSSSTSTALARSTATILLGLTMLMACAAVYAVVGWVVPWYLLLPGIGLALACAGLVEALLALARANRAARAPAYALLALVAVWISWQLSTSPLLRPDRTWVAWTRANDAFLETLQARLDDSPPDGVIQISYPTPVLQPYTVQAWLDLVAPDRHVRVLSQREHDAAPHRGVTVVLTREPARTLQER